MENEKGIKRYSVYYTPQKGKKIKVNVECNSPSDQALRTYADKIWKLFLKEEAGRQGGR